MAVNTIRRASYQGGARSIMNKIGRHLAQVVLIMPTVFIGMTMRVHAVLAGIMPMPDPRTAAEWAVKCLLEGHVPQSPEPQIGYMCENCAESYARQQVEAALERQRGAIKALMAAAKSLMDEAGGKRATNWKTVNDAMVAGAAAIGALSGTG